MTQPIICFGQQPCGFFPKRFLYAKIKSAQNLQSKIGGKVIFFYHDSDADWRETITIMRDIQSRAEVRLNFRQPNRIQKKFSPLYAKHIAAGWKEEAVRQLARFMAADSPLVKLFASVEEDTVADFCLAMYSRLPSLFSNSQEFENREGALLKDIQVERSGDREFREKAADIDEYYADIEYKGEIVRALWQKGEFILHEGGGRYIKLPPQPVEKRQKSPGRDLRFSWMQSVIHCTHYIMGASEKEYLDRAAFPEVTFMERDPIENPEYAWIGLE